jgi:hypothetical protein
MVKTGSMIWVQGGYQMPNHAEGVRASQGAITPSICPNLAGQGSVSRCLYWVVEVGALPCQCRNTLRVGCSGSVLS